MANDSPNCPLLQEQVVDMYFMEHRAKLIDIAAFLDRLDRAQLDEDSKGDEDVRIEALQRAALILAEHKPQRVRRILELFSDPTAQPIDRAPQKGAVGVDPNWRPDSR